MCLLCRFSNGWTHAVCEVGYVGAPNQPILHLGLKDQKSNFFFKKKQEKKKKAQQTTKTQSM